MGAIIKREMEFALSLAAQGSDGTTKSVLLLSAYLYKKLNKLKFCFFASTQIRKGPAMNERDGVFILSLAPKKEAQIILLHKVELKLFPIESKKSQLQ